MRLNRKKWVKKSKRVKKIGLGWIMKKKIFFLLKSRFSGSISNFLCFSKSKCQLVGQKSLFLEKMIFSSKFGKIHVTPRERSKKVLSWVNRSSLGTYSEVRVFCDTFQICHFSWISSSRSDHFMKNNKKYCLAPHT